MVTTTINETLKSEDRRRQSLEIDPVKVLESLSIDNYRIDWKEKGVYVSHDALKILAKCFDKNKKTEGFFAAGWWFKRELR